MRGLWIVGAIAAVALILWVLWPPPEGKPNSGPACLQNLRNIYGSVAIYSEDADHRLPPSIVWNDVLVSYAKSRDAFKCPATASFGYAWNSALGPDKIDKIRTPSTTPLVFDSPLLKKDAVDSPANLPSPPRHDGKNQMLFVDGHAGDAK